MKRKNIKTFEGKLIYGERFYSTTEVLNILKLEAERFRQWIQGGFIKPTIPAGGTGRTHLFVKEYLYIIALFMKLVDLGLSRSVARDIANEFTARDWVEYVTSNDHLYLIVSGKVSPKSGKNWKQYMKISVDHDPYASHRNKIDMDMAKHDVVLIINMVRIAKSVDERTLL